MKGLYDRKGQAHNNGKFNLCNFLLQGRSVSTFPGYSLHAEKEGRSAQREETLASFLVVFQYVSHCAGFVERWCAPIKDTGSQ